MNSGKRIALWLSGLAAVILFGLFVWPTRYRYDHMEVGANRLLLTRENRVTGHTEILYPDGWRAVKPQAENLNPAELAKLNVRANLEDSVFEDRSRWNILCLDIHNESNLDVKEFTVEVRVFNPTNELAIDKQYRISTTSGLYGSQPCSTSETYRSDLKNKDAPNYNSLEQLTHDPNFYKLSEADQIQVLSRVDPGFRGLDQSAQRTILLMHRSNLVLEWAAVDLPPRGTGSFRAPLGFYVTEGQSWSFKLVSAKGAKD
jgi:hypothetical protein